MSAVTTGQFVPSGPQLGGGPARIDGPSMQFDGPGQPDGNNFQADAYQPPVNTPQAVTTSPMQPSATPATPGGKGGFNPGPQLGGGPAPVVDPNAVNPLGPTGQQPTMPQQNISMGGKSGKGGFGAQANPITQEQLQAFARSILNQ